jgi:hypothetical protein
LNVSDIAKGILSGGWSLVAGWILPTAINALIFGLFVLPSLHAVSVFNNLSRSGLPERSLVILGVAVIGGLVLSALQVPLYRVLEGYVWPAAIARESRNRQLRMKRILQDRLDGIRLRTLNDKSRLEQSEDKQRLAALSADPRVTRFAKRDQKRTTVQRAMLRERLRRYPIDDAQVAPTRLGNAIRRLEEYGYNRYRLDSQALWYELTSAAPKELSQQVDAARVGVDFYVCLLYGHLLVAGAALASLTAPRPHYSTLLITAVVLTCLTPAWYELGCVGTDDWALAVRALVDLGRKPLAEGLGLRLPNELDKERRMWRIYCRMVRQPYDSSRATALDEFRFTVEKVAQRDDPCPKNAGETTDSSDRNIEHDRTDGDGSEEGIGEGGGHSITLHSVLA